MKINNFLGIPYRLTQFGMLMALLAGSIFVINAQSHGCSEGSNGSGCLVKVGKLAPDFKVQGVVNGSEIKELSLADFDGKYKVLIFYPLDFTFVCPTELLAFQKALDKFHAKGVEVIAVSVDSVYSHLAWLKTPQDKGGIEGVTYPILSDLNKDIARAYGVLNEEEGVAVRGLFVLNKENEVKGAIVYDLPVGRNTEEVLRLISAVQHVERYGDVCPANWKEGEAAMKADRDSLLDYVAQKNVTRASRGMDMRKMGK